MGALRNICYDVYNTASLVLCEQREITVSIGVIHRASHHTSILERGETSMALNSLDRRRGGAGLRGGPTRSSPWSHPHLRARSGWACLAPCPTALQSLIQELLDSHLDFLLCSGNESDQARGRAN